MYSYPYIVVKKRRVIWKGLVRDNFIIIFILTLGLFASIIYILIAMLKGWEMETLVTCILQHEY